MTGRLLKNILDEYNAAAAAGLEGTGSAAACVCIHGKPRSGKTALIEQVKNALLMNGANVYFYSGESTAGKDTGTGPVLKTAGGPAPPSVLHPVSGRTDDALRELLRQLARMYGSKFDAGITQFITSYAKGTLAADYADISEDDINKDAAIKFIYDCVKSEPAVFVIDDLDRADAYTVRLIDSLLSIGALAFLVISHSDKLENGLLGDVLFRNAKNIKYIMLEGNTDQGAGAITAGSSNDTGSTDGNGGSPDGIDAVFDEAMLVLSKPGRERQLIRHYMKYAGHFAKSLAYERAALILSAALDVCRSLSDSPEDLKLETELLTRLADMQALDNQTSQAIHSYKLAFEATDIAASSQLVLKAPAGQIRNFFNPDNVPPDFTAERIEISGKLADCYKKLDMQMKMREHIMLCEAYLCTPEMRNRYYDLFSKHIARYLDLLSLLGEKVMFREKLKQAYLICRLDDKELTAALHCEEGHMYIDSGDFEKAHGLLLEARAIASETGHRALWDGATNSLAICAERMGQPDSSALLWDELYEKSFDPVKAAWAVVNKAIMIYEQGGDASEAAEEIRRGVDLCILAGDSRSAAQIKDNLKDTPLAL